MQQDESLETLPLFHCSLHMEPDDDMWTADIPETDRDEDDPPQREGRRDVLPMMSLIHVTWPSSTWTKRSDLIAQGSACSPNSQNDELLRIWLPTNAMAHKMTMLWRDKVASEMLAMTICRKYPMATNAKGCINACRGVFR